LNGLKHTNIIKMNI